MKLILPILAMLFTAIMTLTAVVFCMGMGANSTPAQIRALKLWMAGLSLLGAAGVTVGIVFLRKDNFSWATGAAVAPSVIIGIIFIIALLK